MISKTDQGFLKNNPLGLEAIRDEGLLHPVMAEQEQAKVGSNLLFHPDQNYLHQNWRNVEIVESSTTLPNCVRRILCWVRELAFADLQASQL